MLRAIRRECFASRRHEVVALRSGGGEPLCEEWGMPSSVESFCASSIARGIAPRVVSGKLRHLQAKQIRAGEGAKGVRATIGRVRRLLTRPCTKVTLTKRIGVVVRPELGSPGRVDLCVCMCALCIGTMSPMAVPQFRCTCMLQHSWIRMR